MEQKVNNISPVVVFVYSRPEHTKKMLSALSKNSLSECTDLIIYSDGAKSEKINWCLCRTATYQEVNWFQKYHYR